jgi:methionyl-tRNA synthetase
LRKRLITSALPYVNNAPHLGNIIGCVLSADVYARFSRLQGAETLYICGTDGYGTATENKARQAGKTPKEICEEYHVIHEAVYKHFNISFDAFGKTFEPGHSEVVQSIYKDLDEKGALEEQVSSQYFCTSCDTFLADRLIIGECPKCGYEEARGDQCDNCGTLLDPTELKNPQCNEHKTLPELRETKHLYLKLDKLQPQLEEWQNRVGKEGHWTANAIRETASWMKRGLAPRPITRDLKWGVDVPREGYEDKVFYVWFDAPIGYISITKKYFPDTWQDWWQGDDVDLYQFLGKDNIPFHSIIFPGALLGTGKNWNKVHHLNSTEYLNYENTKFSKSRNVGIFGTDVMELEYPIDYWRFYLLSTRPESKDTNFLWQDFFDKVNGELNDNIGNLVNRVILLYLKNFDAKISDIKFEDPTHKELIDGLDPAFEKITAHMEVGEFREAMKSILAVGKTANKFFQDQAPWAQVKENPELGQATLTLLLYVVRGLAVVLQPFIPESSLTILKSLMSEDANWNDIYNFDSLAGKEVTSYQQVFHKMDNLKLEGLKKRFSGNVNEFAKLDIAVAQIKEVEEHPSADHLYVIKVNDGEKDLMSASALRKHYQLEDLKDKKVLIVRNLAVADLRGVKSEAMLLTAEHRKKLELLSNDAWKLGSVVSIDGVDQQIVKDMEFGEFAAIKMNVEENTAKYDGDELLLEGKPIKTQLVAKGKIK